MTIKASTIRPGFLVSLKTNVTGNVKYFTETIEAEHVVDNGGAKAEWNTKKIVSDAAEHEAAIKTRSRVRSIIGSVCAWSEFGLLCREERIEDLFKAVTEARKLADDFNGQSSFSSVSVNVLVGKIASDDAEATKAINSEVAELLANLKQGLTDNDVKVIRDNANRLKELSSMLSDEAAARVNLAIEAARDRARKVAKAVKAGEVAGLVADEQTIRQVIAQRAAFIDVEPEKAVEAPAAVTGAIDFAPVEVVAPKPRQAAQIEL